MDNIFDATTKEGLEQVEQIQREAAAAATKEGEAQVEQVQREAAAATTSETTPEEAYPDPE